MHFLILYEKSKKCQKIKEIKESGQPGSETFKELLPGQYDSSATDDSVKYAGIQDKNLLARRIFLRLVWYTLSKTDKKHSSVLKK